MNERTGWMRTLLILAVGAIVLAFTVGMSAQVQTTKTTTAQAASHEFQVERAEVILVSGNDLVLKMEDGSIRHVSNVPESARATVDGKEIGIQDVKPGMKLERTITTTTTPKVITTTQTLTGKVWHVQPPNSVILTLENGQNQSFKIPKGQKFTVNGQQTDAWGLKKGMMVSATKVVEEPITVIDQQKRLSGKMPPPPPAPAADMPILIASAAPVPVPAPAVTEETPKALPKTGSELPLGALLGFMSLTGTAGLRLFRKVRS
jgi:LPXTG-motif cell wall-anchored protein